MIVVKVGGGTDINYDFVCQDIKNLIEKGEKVILFHGGRGELNRFLKQINKPQKKLTSVSGYSFYYTTREFLEYFEMIYCGKNNKKIVEKLQALGVNAVGLSGIDGRTLEGKKKAAIRVTENSKKKIIKDDLTGKVEKTNTKLLGLLLENDFVPVLCPPAISYESEAMNIDGDRAAAVVAASFKAENYIILSDVPGLLKDVNDENSVIREIHKENAGDFMQYAQGMMKKKVMGAIEALDTGVQRVIFADARVKNPIQNALSGKGTVLW